MLSFMRDQTEKFIKSGKKNNSTEVDAEQTSGGQKGTVQQEYLTVSNKQKQVRRSTYLLAVLFAMGFLN